MSTGVYETPLRCVTESFHDGAHRHQYVQRHAVSMLLSKRARGTDKCESSQSHESIAFVLLNRALQLRLEIDIDKFLATSLLKNARNLNDIDLDLLVPQKVMKNSPHIS